MTKKIAQSNALTNSRYSFSVYQKRFLYYIIKEVRRLYVETSEGNRTVYDNLILNLKPEELKECGKPDIVYKEAVKLREKTISIVRDNEEIAVGWINYIKRNKINKTYEIEVSRQILPELVELAENYHTYELTVALSLKSEYTQRLYELCSQYKQLNGGNFFRELDLLHDKMELPKSYRDFSLMKARVLDPAQKELKSLFDNKESDLYFDYSVCEREKKKVKKLAFKVYNRNQPLEKMNPEDAVWYVRTFLNERFRKDKPYVERIVTAIMQKPEIGPQIVKKITDKIQKYSPKDQPPIIRFVLKEDFGIE